MLIYVIDVIKIIIDDKVTNLEGCINIVCKIYNKKYFLKNFTISFNPMNQSNFILNQIPDATTQLSFIIKKKTFK
jgi:hypothetical protein